MTRTILLFCLLLAGRWCFSQDTVYILHPLVGDIIDRNEKTDYALFPEVPDSTFKYAYVSGKSGRYFLNSYFHPDSVAVMEVDSSTLGFYQSAISEIMASRHPDHFPDSSGSKPPVSIMEPRNNGPTQVKDDILDSYTRDAIHSETMRDARLKDDSEMIKLWKQGSNADNGAIYIDFGYAKKKNK